MLHPAHTPISPAPAAAASLSPAQLAHELNNLLDGSMRSVALVMMRLENQLLAAEDREKVDKYLHLAEASMKQMAQVIERYATSATPAAGTASNGRNVLHREGTLLDALTHAANVYGPVIEQRGIELITKLDPSVGALPAGPVYTVLANGINNALQAIERTTKPGPHRIMLRLIDDAEDILIQVCDTGDGLDPKVLDHRGRFRFGITTRPQGHGVGLGVCRQLAEDLGGALSIVNGPQGGAQLTLSWPKPAEACVDPALIAWARPGARLAG